MRRADIERRHGRRRDRVQGVQHRAELPKPFRSAEVLRVQVGPGTYSMIMKRWAGSTWSSAGASPAAAAAACSFASRS